MSRIHQDRFEVGDTVTWRNEDMATTTNGRVALGGTVTIVGVTEVPGSAWYGVGHTQHVVVESHNGRCFEQCTYSGAFFRHLAPWEKPSPSDKTERADG